MKAANIKIVDAMGRTRRIESESDLRRYYALETAYADEWRMRYCPDVPGMTPGEGLVGYQARLVYCGYTPAFRFI